MTGTEPQGRRGGGRAGRQAARLHAIVERVPFLTRALAPFEVLSEEGLSLIEENAEIVLEQVGVEFRETPDALERLQAAGADVQGERVRFPKGLARRCDKFPNKSFTHYLITTNDHRFDPRRQHLHYQCTSVPFPQGKHRSKTRIRTNLFFPFTMSLQINIAKHSMAKLKAIFQFFQRIGKMHFVFHP